MKIVVFASGRGSNFKAIVENIESGALTNVEVSLLLSNKPEANVLAYAAEKGIPHVCVDEKVSFCPGKKKTPPPAAKPTKKQCSPK